MKKTLLLILTSLVCLAGCKKEDPEPVANESVTQEYTCECGAVYSVTCKNPTSRATAISAWTLITNPSMGNWIVKDASGQNVPHYEALSGKFMYFICTCGEKSKEFNKDDFKTKIFKP